MAYEEVYDFLHGVLRECDNFSTMKLITLETKLNYCIFYGKPFFTTNNIHLNPSLFIIKRINESVSFHQAFNESCEDASFAGIPRLYNMLKPVITSNFINFMSDFFFSIKRFLK